MTGPYVVLHLGCAPLRKVMAPAPLGHPLAGVLFFAPDDAPQRYATVGEAEHAIAVTRSHLERRGAPSEAEMFAVVPLEVWGQDVERRRRGKRKAKRTEAAA